MKWKWNRYLPVEANPTVLRRGFVALTAFSLVCSLSFFNDYVRILLDVKRTALTFPYVQLPPFSLILGFSLYGFWVSALAMIPLAGYFWALHTRLSHSIYTMRRLPDRWELARRCLTLPVLAALFFLGLSLALWLLDFAIYWNVTPDRFLPSSLWEALWS